MYGKNLTEEHQTKARRWWWGSLNLATRRFKQRSLYLTVRHGNKIALRHRHAIQHIQQRGFDCIFPTYERKERLDICRSASQSKSRVNRPNVAYTNGSRIIAKQGELVWPDMVISRRHKRLGNKFKQLASRSICKVAEKSPIKKCSSPCGGLIDPLISPHCGLIGMVISPWGGLIRGVFDTFLSPYSGHHLDIPLYMRTGE